MKLIIENPKKIIATEGYHIRSIDDIYTPETNDEEGNIVPEHLPYYSTEIYVPNSFTEAQMNDLYIEEKIDITETSV